MSGVRTALFVSLAANLLLVGVIGGAAISTARQERTAAVQAVARAPNLRAVLEAVPAERRQAVRGRLVETWRDIRQARLAAQQARAEVSRVASVEPYDAAAVKAAFVRVREADAQVAARLQDAVADALAGLSPEERRAVLEQLARRRATMGARRGMMQRLDPPPQ